VYASCAPLVCACMSSSYEAPKVQRFTSQTKFATLRYGDIDSCAAERIHACEDPIPASNTSKNSSHTGGREVAIPSRPSWRGKNDASGQRRWRVRPGWICEACSAMRVRADLTSRNRDYTAFAGSLPYEASDRHSRQDSCYANP